MKKKYCVCAVGVFDKQGEIKIGRYLDIVKQYDTYEEAVEEIRNFDSEKFWEGKFSRIFKPFKDAKLDSINIEFSYINEIPDSQIWIDTRAVARFTRGNDTKNVMPSRCEIMVIEVPLIDGNFYEEISKETNK